MKISLRKVSALTKQISLQLSKNIVKIDRTRSVEITTISAPDTISNAKINLFQLVNDTLELSNILYRMRLLVQERNKNVGVDVLLNKIETYKINLQVQETLKPSGSTNITFEQAKQQAEKNETVTKNIYSSNERVTVSLVTDEDENVAKTAIINLKKQLSAANDSLLQLNINSLVELTQTEILLLEKYGIVV